MATRLPGIGAHDRIVQTRRYPCRRSRRPPARVATAGKLRRAHRTAKTRNLEPGRFTASRRRTSAEQRISAGPSIAAGGGRSRTGQLRSPASPPGQGVCECSPFNPGTSAESGHRRRELPGDHPDRGRLERAPTLTGRPVVSPHHRLCRQHRSQSGSRAIGVIADPVLAPAPSTNADPHPNTNPDTISGPNPDPNPDVAPRRDGRDHAVDAVRDCDAELHATGIVGTR